MPKNYEDEIRDILRGMERFPGESRAPQPQPGRPRFGARWSGFSGLRRVDTQRLMGGALILMLLGWIMQGPWSSGFPLIYRFAGYVSIAAIVLFIVALVLHMRNGSMGVGGTGRGEQRWRGQVIQMPRRGNLWWSWKRSISRLFSRSGRSGSGPSKKNGLGGQRGRDSVQW